MKKRIGWLVASGLVAAGLLSDLTPARAADHGDGARVRAEPAADITDLYAWMSKSGAKVYLAMDVFPGATATGTAAAKFSDAVKYVFHLNSSATYGAPGPTSVSLVCTFDATQKISCWLVDQGGATLDYVTGDASADSGLVSTNGKFKVFAGLRDDPFFFNLTGFKDTLAAVTGAVPALVAAHAFDAAGCPALPSATVQALDAQLAHGNNGAAPADDFANKNVLAIVVAVDKTAVTPGGPILGVWGSTNQ